MSFPLDLIRRVLLLVGLVLLSVPLWSLAHGSAVLAQPSAAHALDASVLVFVIVAGVLGILDSSLFVESRLFRPALAGGAAVLVLGFCEVLLEYPSPGPALDAVIGAAVTYFDDPAAADLLQPTLAGLEFAALSPLVEIALRRRRRTTRALAGLMPAVAAALLIVAVGKFSVAGAAAFPEVRFPFGLREFVELRLAECAALGWLLWNVFTAPVSNRPGRLALLSGTAAYFAAAFLGAPWIAHVALACASISAGLVAALSPPPRHPAGTGPSRWVFWVLGGLILVSAPVRVWQALQPAAPEFTGAGALQPPLEDILYRIAEQRSTWKVAPETRTVSAIMRWDPAAGGDCYVRIKVDRRPDDEVSLYRDRWSLVRLAIPPGGSPNEAPAITFEVTKESCRLFVGPVTATR